MAKPKTRRKPPINHRQAYQAGYYNGMQTMAIIIRDACDPRDVPALERRAHGEICTRILDSIHLAMHEIEACGRGINH